MAEAASTKALGPRVDSSRAITPSWTTLTFRRSWAHRPHRALRLLALGRLCAVRLAQLRRWASTIMDGDFEDATGPKPGDSLLRVVYGLYDLHDGCGHVYRLLYLHDRGCGALPGSSTSSSLVASLRGTGAVGRVSRPCTPWSWYRSQRSEGHSPTMSPGYVDGPHERK